MQIREYLAQYEEELPNWLRSYENGKEITFLDIMSSRVAYYPGSRYDGTLMKVGNMSHSVHSYLYVDYGLGKKELVAHIEENNSIRGYHCIGRIEWKEKDIMPNGTYPFYANRKPRVLPNFGVLSGEQPYCFTVIMERDADRGDEWGAKRFAVTFLFADGIATYFQLFCKEYRKAPWIFLLQDHGFGGNYDEFGKGGILDEIILKSGVKPEFVLCGDGNTRIWDGYQEVDGVEPIWRHEINNKRVLFKRV